MASAKLRRCLVVRYRVGSSGIVRVEVLRSQVACLCIPWRVVRRGALPTAELTRHFNFLTRPSLVEYLPDEQKIVPRGLDGARPDKPPGASAGVSLGLRKTSPAIGERHTGPLAMDGTNKIGLMRTQGVQPPP